MMEFLAKPETWVLVSFVLFIALLAYLKVPGMIGKALDKRADAIRTELEEAQKLREEAQAILADYRRRQSDAEKEAEEIVRHAKEEAAALKVEAEKKLEENLARRTKLAEEKIARYDAFWELARQVDAQFALIDLTTGQVRDPRAGADVLRQVTVLQALDGLTG